MSKYMIEYIGGVHIPSFLLGLLGSILLYFLSPGLALVLGGLVSFLRFIIICGGIAGTLYFIYLNRNKINRLNGGDENNMIQTKANDYKMQGNTKVGGEFRYFNIPITKLNNDETHEPVERSRWADVNKVNSLEVSKMRRMSDDAIIEEVEEVPKRRINESMNLRIMGSKTQVLNRNARYENFVNLAGANRH